MVISIIFDFDISLISASLEAVKWINDGSFFLPLFGTGANMDYQFQLEVYLMEWT